VLITKPVRDVLAATARAQIVRIDLQGEAFPYIAGQAVWVGAAGSEQRRPYSLADSPEHAERDGVLELLVGIDVDAAAGGLHLTLQPGTRVDIEGPVGRFTFPEHPLERRFLFIAGGTGIAPLRAMLRHALTVPHDAIGCLFSARTPGDFAYKDELRALAARGEIELELRVTRDTAGVDWSGTRGRLALNDLAPLVHDRATLCFVCGPPALVDEIPRALETLGVSRERIRREEWI
jgi:ferredoxin-NADP reductase